MTPTPHPKPKGTPASNRLKELQDSVKQEAASELQNLMDFMKTLAEDAEGLAVIDIYTKPQREAFTRIAFFLESEISGLKPKVTERPQQPMLVAAE